MSKKKKRKQNAPAPQNAQAAKPVASPSKKGSSPVKSVGMLSRRTLIRSAAGIGVALAAGAGIHAFDSKDKELHDLTVIGGGKPVVVQVHDPSCPTCRKLKRATEKALETLPQIEYRIADLRSKEGRSMAEQYGVGKVTLLLFSDRGKHLGTVQGVQPAEDLRRAFEHQFTL